MPFSDHILGTFALSSNTQVAGTAIASLVRPYRGNGGDRTLYKMVGDRPNWAGWPFTHISQLVYTAAGTAHNVVIMRPLNYAVISADVAANATGFALKTDPGLYSTSYKYDLPGEAAGVGSAAVANNAIAAGDYVCYQLRDGTWVADTVASGTYAALVLTTATPNVAGGGVESGSPMFFFGVSTDLDPATGAAQPTLASVASARQSLLSDTAFGTVAGLHPGDPLLVFSGNATAAGTLAMCTGFYSRKG
jgi:hypothetical protein